METIGSSQITPRRGLVLSWTGDEAILVDEPRGKVHVLNGTASRVWELCESHETVEGLLQAVAREYDVKAKDIEEDLVCVLQVFRELDLIELATPS